MAEPLRLTTNLQEVASNASTEAPPTKKQKKVSKKIMTFGISHSPVQVQLLSTHTIHHLIDMLCRSTTIGQEGDVYGHMWYVTLPSGVKYESGDTACVSQMRAKETKLGDLHLTPPTSLTFMYDYGDNWEYSITLVGESSLSDEDDEAAFPRPKPVATPTGYALYETNQVNLNTVFATLNTWAFSSVHSLDFNLFQAGRKQNFGFLCLKGNGIKQMMFLPAKPKRGLADYLHCLNESATFKYKTLPEYGCPCYNWHSVVVLPYEDVKLRSKYGKHLEPGFCDMTVAPANVSLPILEDVFPKVAALAGTTKKKDKKVPKGWICYKDRTLLVCSGNTETKKCNAPPGTAFHGEDQHKPEDNVLFSISIEIQSLHELFCVVEGLLRTL